MPRHAGMPSELPLHLKQRAQLISRAADGLYEAAERLPGLDTLTDGLMVLALMAVEGCEQLGANEQKRLLPRRIADAMGVWVSLWLQEANKELNIC